MKPIPLGNDSREKVPDKWKVLSLRRLIGQRPDGIKMGPFGSQLRLEYMDDDGPYKVYGQENVISGDFSAGSKFIGAEKFNELAACEIRPGDVVITMMGTAGRCAVVPPSAQRGIMDSHLVRIRCDPTLLIPVLPRCFLIKLPMLSINFFVPRRARSCKGSTRQS